MYLNKEGNQCCFELVNRTIGISAADLKKIPFVIGVSGGMGKKNAIKLALQAGYFHAIVTDEKTGDYLLRE